MQVIKSLKSRVVRLPIHSATDVVAGGLMIKGATAETDLGTLIVNAAASAANYVGILVAGAAPSAVIAAATGAAWFAPQGGDSKIFPSRLVELTEGATMCRLDYDLTGVAATSSDGTTVTVGSLEDNIDTGFLYVATAGTGTDDGVVGMLRFIDTSAAGSCTTSVTMGAGDALGAGLVVKILPLLHGLFVLTVPNTTTPTKLGTTAAAGAARLVQFERHIVRNGLDEMMDPYTHGNLSGLNSLAQLKFYGVCAMNATVFSPLS